MCVWHFPSSHPDISEIVRNVNLDDAFVNLFFSFIQGTHTHTHCFVLHRFSLFLLTFFSPRAISFRLHCCLLAGWFNVFMHVYVVALLSLSSMNCHCHWYFVFVFNTCHCVHDFAVTECRLVLFLSNYAFVVCVFFFCFFFFFATHPFVVLFLLFLSFLFWLLLLLLLPLCVASYWNILLRVRYFFFIEGIEKQWPYTTNKTIYLCVCSGCSLQNHLIINNKSAWKKT